VAGAAVWSRFPVSLRQSNIMTLRRFSRNCFIQKSIHPLRLNQFVH
jgi:hypothetical protein